MQVDRKYRVMELARYLLNIGYWLCHCCRVLIGYSTLLCRQRS